MLFIFIYITTTAVAKTVGVAAVVDFREVEMVAYDSTGACSKGMEHGITSCRVVIVWRWQDQGEVVQFSQVGEERDEGCAASFRDAVVDYDLRV